MFKRESSPKVPRAEFRIETPRHHLFRRRSVMPATGYVGGRRPPFLESREIRGTCEIEHGSRATGVSIILPLSYRGVLDITSYWKTAS